MRKVKKTQDKASQKNQSLNHTNSTKKQ